MRKLKKPGAAALALVLMLALIPAVAPNAAAATSGKYEYSVSGGQATITRYTGNASNLTIPGTLGGYPVTAIGNFVFARYTALKSVTIPNSVTSIGTSAFYSCTALTSVTIPNSVTEIRTGAFCGCTALKSITIPNSVTSIGEGAFDYCTALKSITIPNSVTSIGRGAFVLCTSLTSVTIPKSVTSIGDDPFGYCTALKSISVDSANANFSSLNGVLFNKNRTKIIQYPGGKTGSTYSIPKSVTIIGNDAFSYCNALTSVTIPNSVTEIGDWAFQDCNNLKSITIPNSVTSIGRASFGSCESLKSITIPNSVTSISGSAFMGSTSVTISCYSGSTAHTYAKANSIPYKLLNNTITVGKVGALKLSNDNEGVIRVRYNKVSGAAGYQFTVSTASNFASGVSGSKSYTGYVKNEIKTCSGKNLKTGTTYYVRARAYKLDSTGARVWGSYSNSVSIRLTK